MLRLDAFARRNLCSILLLDMYKHIYISSVQNEHDWRPIFRQECACVCKIFAGLEETSLNIYFIYIYIDIDITWILASVAVKSAILRVASLSSLERLETSPSFVFSRRPPRRALATKNPSASKYVLGTWMMMHGNGTCMQRPGAWKDPPRVYPATCVPDFSEILSHRGVCCSAITSGTLQTWLYIYI